MKDLRNKSVEHFFLETMHNKENLAMNLCSLYLYRYYQELEDPEKFNSESYKNQDDRIDDMFPGMPEAPKNLLKLKAYQHQLEKEKRDGVCDEEKNEYNEKRIEELSPVVTETEYSEYTLLRWWNA